MKKLTLLILVLSVSVFVSCDSNAGGAEQFLINEVNKIAYEEAVDSIDAKIKHVNELTKPALERVIDGDRNPKSLKAVEDGFNLRKELDSLRLKYSTKVDSLKELNAY